MRPVTLICTAFASILLFLTACKKPAGGDPPPPGFELKYADSVVYLNGQSNQTTRPLTPANGRYSAQPEGLVINASTGEVDIDASETGLRYRIKFVAGDGSQHVTYLTIGGINYFDEYYYPGDSLVRPIYNGNPGNPLPSGTYAAYNDNGQLLNVMEPDGKLNVRKLLRTGLLRWPPREGEWDIIDVRYRHNDASNAAPNKLKVILYYYDHANQVPDYVLEILQQRVGLLNYMPPTPIIGNETFKNGLNADLAAKPRPPCIIIIGN